MNPLLTLLLYVQDNGCLAAKDIQAVRASIEKRNVGDLTFKQFKLYSHIMCAWRIIGT